MYDYDLHTRAPAPLVEAARSQAPGLGLGAVVRLALARFAGWPESAVQSVARGAPLPGSTAAPGKEQSTHAHHS